jgi:hypothetical protein
MSNSAPPDNLLVRALGVRQLTASIFTTRWVAESLYSRIHISSSGILPTAV